MVIRSNKSMSQEGKIPNKANIYTEVGDGLMIYVDDCEITDVTVDNLGHKNLTIKRRA